MRELDPIIDADLRAREGRGLGRSMEAISERWEMYAMEQHLERPAGVNETRRYHTWNDVYAMDNHITIE